MTLLSVAEPGRAADEAVPARELARERYEVVTDPAQLPNGVQAAWASELRQARLDVAVAGGEFNSTDKGVPGLTRHRLVMAAVGPKHAVVYFETGGIALYRRVFVFSRAADPATLSWSGRPRKTYQDSKRFLGAIRSGDLWRVLRQPAR